MCFEYVNGVWNIFFEPYKTIPAHSFFDGFARCDVIIIGGAITMLKFPFHKVLGACTFGWVFKFATGTKFSLKCAVRKKKELQKLVFVLLQLCGTGYKCLHINTVWVAACCVLCSHIVVLWDSPSGKWLDCAGQHPVADLEKSQSSDWWRGHSRGKCFHVCMGTAAKLREMHPATLVVFRGSHHVRFNHPETQPKSRCNPPMLKPHDARPPSRVSDKST